jgi:serine/threonine-protein kinase
MIEELGVHAGQMVADRYRLESLLGRGGMGSVWKAEHLQLGSPVALKVLKPAVARNKNSVARFIREAKAAALLRSPHVVQILDYGQDGEIVYMAMELLDGESLHARLRQGALDRDLVATVMTHVGRAVGRAHEMGIVHRDLKPDNVFLVENDDEIVAKVLDFGIAKADVWGLEVSSEAPTTQTGALLGTPYYMSPEQATGQKDVDHRADLWALGVITYECLLGKRPYRSDSLGDLVLQICTRPQPVPSQLGSVPAGFDAWFARAQARDREDRFQSARDMVSELRRILAPAAPPGGLDTPREAMPSDPLAAPSVTQAPAAAPLGETFEPLSATPAPRRGVLVGAGLGAGALLLAALVWLQTRTSTEGSGASTVEPAAGAPAPSTTAAAPVAPPVTAAAPTTAVPPPTASATAQSSALLPRRPPPIGLPRPSVQPLKPPAPPPPDDKLGI